MTSICSLNIPASFMHTAKQPWIITQMCWFYYTGVQEQALFPFVCQQTFMLVSLFLSYPKNTH